MRDKDNLPSETAQFDKYTNDMWHVRHSTLGRFAQAARKVSMELSPLFLSSFSHKSFETLEFRLPFPLLKGSTCYER